MFKSITLENFFSFGRETKIELNPGVNMLVGINGSGKSNFLRAIELLEEGMNGSGLKKLINGKWGGLVSVQFSSAKIKDEVTFTFEIIPAPFEPLALWPDFGGMETTATYHLNLFSNGKSDYQFKEQIEIGTPDKKVFNLADWSEHPWNNRPPFDLLVSDDNFFSELPEGLQIKLHRPKAIYSSFDTSRSSKLRSLAGYQDHPRLLPDGENLVGLLSYLNTNDLKSFDLITEQLRDVNPHFKELAFAVPIAGKTLLTLKEKHLNRAVPIDFISDGTLRFLLLMAILYNPKRGAVVCLDEPEMGLHPDMISSVADGIKYAAQTGTQMIVSTHSPLLLNAFELDDILIFEKDSENQTIVNRKSEEDFQDWQGEFLAGQMWMRGQLGGTRW